MALLEERMSQLERQVTQIELKLPGFQATVQELADAATRSFKRAAQANRREVGGDAPLPPSVETPGSAARLDPISERILARRLRRRAPLGNGLSSPE